MIELVVIMHGAAVSIAAIAAVTDARTGEIPNWLTLPPLLIAPVAYGLGAGFPALLWSLGGLVACGLVPFLLFRMDAIGGGDVKLLAALGALTAAPPGPAGLTVGIEAELYAFVLASLYSLARFAWHGNLLSMLGRAFFLCLNPVLPRRLRRPVERELLTTLRFGVPIFAGVVLAIVLHHLGRGGLSV